MKILFFGDIVGKIGRQAIKKTLADYKKKYQPDFIIANGENLAHGKGATQKTLEEMQQAGINFFTSGNHIWKKNEILDVFKQGDIPIIRPANYPEGVPGEGHKIVEVGEYKILVINLLGRVFIREDLDCPFKKFDEIIKINSRKKIHAIFVDLHAEATSEHVAFGFYANGRASAVVGTHTHVPTADQQILDQGTAYVTDVGMVGGQDTVLGVAKEEIIQTFLTQMPFSHLIPEKGPAVINAVLIEIDPKTKEAKSIQRVDKIVKI
ncbi:MAG: TIGR00282 family metallophosphoesterase [Patescibacteria group bacterium]|nr:TIGR00282 family metallophosphoesterase [Patescibacteria group bacterium]